MEGESTETKVLRDQAEKLEMALIPDLQFVAYEMNKAFLLSDRELTDIRTVPSVLRDDQKAGKVVSALKIKVKLQSNNFQKFVSILEMKPDQFENIIELLKIPRMAILVRIHNSEDPISLNVDKSDIIRDVKCKVQNETGIPTDQQQLSFDGKKLEDSHTLSYYKIKNKFTLKLKRVGMLIHVNGKDIALHLTVRDYSRVNSIKSEIEVKTGIHPHSQILFFGGKELENDRALSDYDIRDGATIILKTRLLVHVTIPNSSDPQTTLHAATVADIKSTIQEKYHIPPSLQELTFGNKRLEDGSALSDYNVENRSELSLKMSFSVNVITSGGCTVIKNLKVDYFDKVENLKSEIERQTRKKYLSHKQLLKLDERELEISDKLCDVADPKSVGAAMNIILHELHDVIHVSIHMESSEKQKITLEVKTSHRADYLKSLIEKEVNIPKNRQKLYFGSDELLDDTCPISNYNIKEGSIINLEHYFKISIACVSDEEIAIDVGVHKTIQNMKSIIQKISKEKLAVEILPGQQQLEFDGKQLIDEHTLLDSQIQDSSVIHLKTSLQVNVVVQPDIFPFTVDYFSYISELKMAIETSRNDIPASKQKLMHNDSELKDSHTFIDYISMWNKKPPIDIFVHYHDEDIRLYIHTETPQTIKCLDLKTSYTIETLIEKVREEFVVESSETRLTYKGTELSDVNRTLQSYNIQNNDTVDLHHNDIAIYVTHNSKMVLDTVMKTSDTIEIVKRTIRDTSGIDCSIRLRLVYQDRELSDNSRTLKHYSIPHKAVLNLIPEAKCVML